MKLQKYLLTYVLLYVLIGSFSQICAAQDDGYIKSLSADNGGLPPGAVYENGFVSHPLTSAEENLHLLAGYYYRNPREWRRIYQENRNVIGNPNSLPIGQTLKIHVGENWKPLFSYEEWFRLANRNGQWKSGQPWRPARVSSGAVPAPPSTPAPKVESKMAAPAPAPEIKPKVAPKEQKSPPAPVEKQQPPPKETPPEETPELEETPVPQEFDEGAEEAAPAF